MREWFAYTSPGCRACILGVLAVMAAGCDSRPRAPRLENGPVYKNQREGFRFFVPEGWQQRARGEVPPGKILSERVLTEYKCMTCATPTAILVSVADVPEATPLSDYVTKSTATGEKWNLAAPPEDFTINGVPAARIKYVQRVGRTETIREIVAFRRGERVYLFKGFYAASDEKSQKAIRSTVETVVW